MSQLQARLFVLVAGIASFASLATAQTPDEQAASTCAGVGCSALSRADLFIKTFASSGGSRGLRTSQLEQEEQVRLAFYGMDATRLEIAAGRLTEQEGNFIIDGHERVIRNYVQDKANEAAVRAATGQASDIPAITKSLSGLLSVARQDALVGREELAERAQAQMVRVLTTFSQQFANTCEQQSFPVEVALALERQNELMGTGISLMHCTSRKISAELTSQGVSYQFESCSNLSNLTEWDLRISGRVTGIGRISSGRWEANVIFQGYEQNPTGAVETTYDEIEEQEDSVAVPEDAGPNARANGRTSAPIPELTPRPRKKQIQKLRITTIILEGDRGFWGWTARPAPWHSSAHWADAEVKREDKPCRATQ